MHREAWERIVWGLFVENGEDATLKIRDKQTQLRLIYIICFITILPQQNDVHIAETIIVLTMATDDPSVSTSSAIFILPLKVFCQPILFIIVQIFSPAIRFPRSTSIELIWTLWLAMRIMLN